MFAHIGLRSAGVGRRTMGSWRLGALAGLVLGLMTSACSQTPPVPVAGRDPSDPQAPVRPVTYRSTVSGYTSQRPVEPRPWGEQNERVAPRP